MGVLRGWDADTVGQVGADVADVCWWTEDELLLVRLDGTLAVCAHDDLFEPAHSLFRLRIECFGLNGENFGLPKTHPG